MKLLQYIGPFKSGDIITVPAMTDCTYTHIGIQIPNREYIQNITNKKTSADIIANDKEYRINDKGILEFDETAELTWNIKFLKDMPFEAIIDIAYDIKDI